MRELYERTTLPGKIEPLEPLPTIPSTPMSSNGGMPGLGIMAGTLCGLRQIARAKGAPSANQDDLLLAINLRGCSIAHQDNLLQLESGEE